MFATLYRDLFHRFCTLRSVDKLGQICLFRSLLWGHFGVISESRSSPVGGVTPSWQTAKFHLVNRWNKPTKMSLLGWTEVEMTGFEESSSEVKTPSSWDSDWPVLVLLSCAMAFSGSADQLIYDATCKDKKKGIFWISVFHQKESLLRTSVVFREPRVMLKIHQGSFFWGGGGSKSVFSNSTNSGLT